VNIIIIYQSKILIANVAIKLCIKLLQSPLPFLDFTRFCRQWKSIKYNIRSHSCSSKPLTNASRKYQPTWNIETLWLWYDRLFFKLKIVTASSHLDRFPVGDMDKTKALWIQQEASIAAILPKKSVKFLLLW
jgi:hypothetical protein